MMADDSGGDDVFVYMGGDQVVPWDVTRAVVDPSVDTIRARAFFKCRHLESIKMHDGVKTIQFQAFFQCRSLRRIELLGVRLIESCAFANCTALEEVEFGNQLDIIMVHVFYRTALRNIKLPKVRVIGEGAFRDCLGLTEVELSGDLERIESRDLEAIGGGSGCGGAFQDCRRLRRIAIPLKKILFGENVFDGCDDLTQVDLVGGIHKSISSLHLESWRDEMKEEIGRINVDFPNANERIAAIQEWIGGVLRKMEHYKLAHYALLKDNMTHLELALWDAKLQNGATNRHEALVNCGANIIIPHVLSFLNDHDVFPIVEEQGTIAAQMQRLTIDDSSATNNRNDCLHGQFLGRDRISEFMYEFDGAWMQHLSSGVCLGRCFQLGIDATREDFANVLEDVTKLDEVLSRYSGFAAKKLLNDDDRNIEAHYLVCIIFFLEEYTACLLTDPPKANINYARLHELFHSDVPTLVSFVRNRIPCRCLEHLFPLLHHDLATQRD